MNTHIPFHHKIPRRQFSSALHSSLTGTASTNGTESPIHNHTHTRKVKNVHIHKTILIIVCDHDLTGLSLGSMKKILMMISNSPQPVSVISYGGFVTTERKLNSSLALLLIDNSGSQQAAWMCCKAPLTSQWVTVALM